MAVTVSALSFYCCLRLLECSSKWSLLRAAMHGGRSGHLNDFSSKEVVTVIRVAILGLVLFRLQNKSDSTGFPTVKS